MDTSADNSDQRAFPRSPIRATAVVVIPSTNGETISQTCWTDDLSAGGARLLAAQEIRSEEIFIRILNPALQDKLFKAKITRKDPVIVRALGFFEELKRYPYGICFCEISQDPVLQRASGIQSDQLAERTAAV